MRLHPSLVAGALIALIASAVAGAQTPAAPPRPATTPPSPAPLMTPMFQSPGPLTPLKVQVVVSRYQGDKKVSSLPYVLSVNANDGVLDASGQYIPHGGPARLRTGAQVPVPDLETKDRPVQNLAALPVTYKAIGTNIDCYAHSTGDGRFRVGLSIDDTSVYAEGKTAEGLAPLAAVPSFRSFQFSNRVILKDGQTTQFTVATDKITGELTRVDVTINVEK